MKKNEFIIWKTLELLMIIDKKSFLNMPMDRVLTN